MSKFKRRPFMAGHTDVFVMSQPYLTGTEHINSDGLLDSIEALTSGVTQFELSFETEEGSGNFQLDVAVTAEADRTLAAIVEALNTAFGASSVSSLIEASDFEGCLRIQSLGSGLVDTPPLDGIPDTLSYIKILPNDSGSSFVDGADLFGFPSFPHPAAVATAGDLAHSPVRPLTQINRPGAAFLARGEDRVSQNFNRALHQLSINEDSLNTRLKARVPVPTVLDIDRTSTRLLKDASDRIVGLTLYGTHSDSLDSILGEESRVFVGGLSNTSSLLEIANFFSVQDQEDNQIQADQRVVRVGAVTSGYTGVISVPTFVSESGAPTSGVPDSTVPLDNGNLLGLQYEKTAATVINSIKDGCVLVCDSATFSTDGVIKGDLVTIAGSTITAPISHNGTYYVETVISETELEVRPVDHDNVLILNESESGGLGSATVTTDGSFAQNVVLMFSPPIADFPPDRVAEDGTTPITGVLRIVLGLEALLGEVPSEFLTRSTVKTAAEVDAFVTRRVWRRMSFDGLYQGQSYDFRGSQQGGGAEGRITHGPISLSVASNRDRPASLTAEMTGTGSLEMRGDDLVLTAAPTFVFSDTDIGKVVFVSDTGGTLFADETPFVLSEFLSYREIRLTPPVDYKDWRTSDLAGSTSCSFEVVSEGQAAIQAAMMFVANDKTAAGDAAAKAGLVFVRNHRDGADGDVSPGTSLLHLERIRNVKTRNAGVNSDADAHFLSASTTAAARTITLTGTTSSDVVHLKDNTHLFWSENATVKSSNGIGCTLLRIVNGPNAGFYEVHELSVDTGVFTVQPIENAFDGATTWAGFISTSVTQVANLYNVVFSVGGKRTAQDPVLGAVEVTSGVTAFADAADKVAEGTYTPSAGVARAIQAHWIGEGSALHVRVNDPDFYSIGSVSASTGYAIDVRVYNPAQGGYVRAHANFSSGRAADRAARALRLHTDSSTVDRKRESVPSDVLTEASGSSLEATSRYADPAIKVMAGTAEDPQHTKLFPGGPFPDTSASALVIMDNRYADLTGGATDTSTDQINVPQGLRVGALTITGATTINRESPVFSMSPILSSAVAPLFALRSSVGFGSSIPTESPTWTSAANYTLFENSSSHGIFGAWPGKSAHLMPGWSDRYYAHTASASLGFPELDLNYPTAGSSSGTITLSSSDYSLFQTKHEYVLSLPAGQTLFGGPSDFAEHLPGRVLWVSLDDGTGAGEATHSFLFRVEAMVVSSGIRLALYAQDEGGHRPNLMAWTVISCGLKAARWSHAYIDIADSMMIGSAYQKSGLSSLELYEESLSQASSHSPILTLLRTSPYAPQGDYIGSDWYDIEKDADGLASIEYTGGATVTVTAANLGLLSDNVVSLGPSGFIKFSFFADMGANPTGQALWLLNHAIPGFSQESSPFSQFFLGGGATWTQYDDGIVNTPQWNVYAPEIDLLGAEADRKIFRNGYFFESIALPASDRSRIDTALTGMLSDSSHIVRWSPHRGGSLSLTQSRVGQSPAVNELSGTRIWMPVGRSFSSEYLNLRVSVAGSHILESIYGADMATPWATHTGFLIAIRRADGTAIATKEMTLEVAAGSTDHLLEKAFSNSQDIQTGLTFSDFGGNGLGGQSPTFREDGSLNKGRAETSEPLFVTIDFYTLRLSSTESLDSTKAVELYATLPELGGGTSPVIPLPYETISGSDANNGRLIFSALQVTDVRPPAYLTGSAAVGGTVTARNFRYRDAVTKYLSSGPEKVQFHTGLRYSNVASSHTFSMSPAADNYYPSGSVALVGQQTGNMTLGKSAFDGLGPITGMFQPLYGSAGGFRSIERLGYTTDSALDADISAEGMGDHAFTLGTSNTQDSVRLVNDLFGSVSGSVNSKTAVASAPAGLTTPKGLGSSTTVPDSALNLTYTAQGEPWVQVTHDQSVQFHRGVSGASIVGHHSNDPLWYQCEALSRKRSPSSPQYLVRGVSDGYTSTARNAEFLFHRNGVVMPGPTGFVVPIEAPDGTLLTEFSWHVSITPRVWSQTTDIYEYSSEKPGTYADGSLDPLPDHVNTPEKQADWGIYHSCPQSADGVTSPPAFGVSESCLSHAVGEWEAKAGFAVDIYRLKIGSSSNPENWTNFDHLEEHSMAERVHTSTVSLSSLDKQPHEVVDQHYPAATGHHRSTGVIFMWSGAHAAEVGATGHPRYTPPNECHIKGTEDVSIEIDRSQYTYFAVIRAFVTGDRLFTSLAHIGSTDVAAATGFADSAGSLYWYSHCGPGSHFQKSAGDLPGVWASGWSELSETTSHIDSSLVPLWVNSQSGVSSMGKSATCRVGTNPFGVPAFSSPAPGGAVGFGLREHFTPPVFTFRASRSAYKTDKP